jgi:hypothetical protein
LNVYCRKKHLQFNPKINRQTSAFAAPYLDKEEVKKDYRAFTLLNSFLRPLAQITRNLDDTAEMNVPGAKAVYEDLKVRYEQQKTKTKKAEPVK